MIEHHIMSKKQYASKSRNMYTSIYRVFVKGKNTHTVLKPKVYSLCFESKKFFCLPIENQS